MKLLIKFSDNYADEFDVDGFRVMTSEEWEEYQAFVKGIAWPQAFYFGTNEGIEYDTADDLLRNYTVEEISDEQAEFLQANLIPNSWAYGTWLGPHPDDAE